MLQGANINAEYRSPEVDEDKEKLDFKGSCLDLALYLSKLKALSVKEKDAYIIGCDQVCELEGEVINKGGDFENSKKILQRMQDKQHFQNTAMAIVLNNKVVFEYKFISKLTMKPLSAEEITEYLHKDTPFYCAGSYKLEENGRSLFSKIEGRDDCIQGFPLKALQEFLKKITKN